MDERFSHLRQNQVLAVFRFGEEPTPENTVGHVTFVLRFFFESFKFFGFMRKFCGNHHLEQCTFLQSVKVDGLEQFLFGIVRVAFGEHLADAEYKGVFQKVTQRV